MAAVTTSLLLATSACSISDVFGGKKEEVSSKEDKANDKQNNNNSNSNSNSNNNENNNNNSNSNSNNNGNNNNSNSSSNSNNNGNNNSNSNSNNNNNQSNNQKPSGSVTLEQHGVIVTVHSVEQAEDIVRVKYTVNNTTDIPVSAGAPGAKIEQNGKSKMPTSFEGNWDQRGIVAPHTSVDGTNLYTLPNIPNEFDFKITPTFQDDSKINLIQPFILKVKM